MKCTRPLVLYFDSEGNRVPEPKSLEWPEGIYSRYIPCGKCLACRINRTREWTLRLLHEEVFSDSAYFVTFTYDEDHVKFDSYGNMAVCKDDVQKFFKRLRKALPGVEIRYFLNSEYGPESGRPHYHALIFNIPQDRMFENARRIYRKGSISFTCPFLMSIWQQGNVEFGTASKERAGYTAKYFINRKDIDDILVPNFSLMSRRPGIGNSYAHRIAEKVRSGINGCLNANGTYVALPRYYRLLTLPEEERHQRWVELLQDDKLDEDYEIMLKNADLVEQNQFRAMTWKGKKSKI